MTPSPVVRGPDSALTMLDHDLAACLKMNWCLMNSLHPSMESLNWHLKMIFASRPGDGRGSRECLVISIHFITGTVHQAQVQAPHQVHKSPILKPCNWAIAESNYEYTLVKLSILFLCSQQKDRMQRTSGEFIFKQVSLTFPPSTCDSCVVL